MPQIFFVEDFLTAAECDELMRCADPMLIRSKTDSGVSEVRTSRSTHLRKATPPCPAVLRKVLALTRKLRKDLLGQRIQAVVRNCCQGRSSRVSAPVSRRGLHLLDARHEALCQRGNVLFCCLGFVALAPNTY